MTVAGVSAEAAEAGAAAQLRRHGAVPVQSAEYTRNGTWKQFGDNRSGNDHVDFYWSDHEAGQNYLTQTRAATVWNDVETSSFEFRYAGITGDCPSLVDECDGDQTFNDRNEAGWIDLGGASGGSITLGVTWFNFRTRGGPFAAPQEADVALNSNDDAVFHIETVAAHEMGHAAGLGHSGDDTALMYAWYGGPQDPLLGDDDIAGISALYPADGGSDDSGTQPGYCKKHPERDGC